MYVPVNDMLLVHDRFAPDTQDTGEINWIFMYRSNEGDYDNYRAYTLPIDYRSILIMEPHVQRACPFVQLIR